MKVTMEIDCTPAEARLFFGLPNVEPMQDAVMAQLEKRMLTEMDRFSPEGIMKAGCRCSRRTPNGFRRCSVRCSWEEPDNEGTSRIRDAPIVAGGAARAGLRDTAQPRGLAQRALKVAAACRSSGSTG